MTGLEQKSKIEDFIKQGEIISKQELHIPEDGLCILDYIDGPKFDKWMCDIKIFSSRHLSEHILFNKIQYICDKYKRLSSPYDDMITCLKGILDDYEYWAKKDVSTKQESNINLSKDSEKLLLILLAIQENNKEICIRDNDQRLSEIENYEKILNRLNSEGYFELFKPNIIGEYDIELSEKALIYKSSNELSREHGTNYKKEINLNFYGNVNNSNVSTGDDSKQNLDINNADTKNSEKNRFEKYWIPIIVAIIGTTGAIIASIISSIN